MEEGSQRSFQFAQLQPSILQTIHVSSIKWNHNDTSRRTVWIDWHAPRHPSAHTILASIVLPHHFRPLSLVRRRSYGHLPNINYVTDSDIVDIEVQLLLGEGSIAKKKSPWSSSDGSSI